VLWDAETRCSKSYERVENRNKVSEWVVEWENSQVALG
jgi:hypothetical protein